MSATAYRRGHPIRFDADTQVWRYVDTGQPADHERPCPNCGLLATPDGPDPCLGTLPHVTAACCGHGVAERYVMDAAYDVANFGSPPDAGAGT